MELFLSAGDLSGDNAAARLVAALRTHDPGLRLCGLGRTRLARLGQEQFAPGGDLAVIGFWEVAKRLPYFRRLLARCADEIARRAPRAVILVDYPGFNLRLARRVRRLGIPIIYYISPQIWAWGSKRLREIEQLVDLMLVILPFEEDFYRGSRVNVRFVGHYLLEDIAAEMIASPPPERMAGGLALLPGSRPQEIDRLLGPMLETARRFTRAHGTRAVVAALAGAYPYDAALRAEDHAAITVAYDDARRVIHDSALVLTASGTATLEAAVIGRPMVVAYRTGEITYRIARRLITLDKIALVNLVAGQEVVPELVQHEATPDRMTAALERLWNDRELYLRTAAALGRIPGLLGGTGASDRAARLIIDHLEGK
ncbi:MAG TPA: lipid-A-disaccharide synthase [candidate division Zixibacteria bacterium]|nr:lipid-A-disaccharide synthase [candidate division Zixibacteria bacterium]MDD4916292.1 lipid-A-disaccharide synthase [candidate division Zixibacteria bacterium]MDM7973673.1 lipid-A-disaccharide synthase [candidate division Zixibacteria bacterium]HOD65727.1 lipid-A-disaccharide synthase [candidate division Zixibacteria bacterium]HOZ06999.1 lipid-A-disaccharide synthase [candidate division Zixibacteria bacterium]